MTSVHKTSLIALFVRLLMEFFSQPFFPNHHHQGYWFATRKKASHIKQQFCAIINIHILNIQRLTHSHVKVSHSTQLNIFHSIKSRPIFSMDSKFRQNIRCSPVSCVTCVYLIVIASGYYISSPHPQKRQKERKKDDSMSCVWVMCACGSTSWPMFGCYEEMENSSHATFGIFAPFSLFLPGGVRRLWICRDVLLFDLVPQLEVFDIKMHSA